MVDLGSEVTDIWVDGLHMNEKGNREIFNRVLPVLKDPPYWRANWRDWE